MTNRERHISAGPKALAVVSRWLGLNEGDRNWRLEGLCGLGQSLVRIGLQNGEHRFVFFLLPRSAPEASVRSAKLGLAADSGGGPAAAGLLKAMARRLGDRSLAGMMRVLESDPLSYVELLNPGEPADRVRVPCIGQPGELLEAGWRNFFADQDFEVILGVPECLPKGTVTIQYADSECHYARPRRSFRKWNFLDWPEIGLDEIPRRDEGAETLIVAELEERDMIMGSGERADAMVERARALAADGKFLIFSHLCTPIVMGEDFQGLARRCVKEAGGTAVSWSQKDRDENNNFGEHFRSLLSRPGFFAGPGDPEAVNLFHFPQAYREEELEAFLAGIGLKTNIRVFPEVDFPSLENLPRAVWQVFCARGSYPTKVRELLAASPRPVVPVAAPYGVAQTRECLRAIAAAAGKDAKFEARWQERMAEFLPAWEESRREAAGYRLAFVVSEATLPRLLALRYGHGAPLAAMVQEMGFGIDLLYYDIHGCAPNLPEGLRQARVAVFRSPWELARALLEGRFAAVFSDVFFDWRIARAGKARFASRDFEMGLEGARRSLDRLLALCRLPFYRLYAGHLGGLGGPRA